jgi:hypothetical protein
MLTARQTNQMTKFSYHATILHICVAHIICISYSIDMHFNKFNKIFLFLLF